MNIEARMAQIKQKGEFTNEKQMNIEARMAQIKQEGELTNEKAII
jgi:hypothetical protein